MRSERERVDTVAEEGLAPGRTGPGGRERAEHRGPPVEPTPPHAHDDEAAEVKGKDVVQRGSEGAFPASDPPSWMGGAVPCGRNTPGGGEGSR